MRFGTKCSWPSPDQPRLISLALLAPSHSLHSTRANSNRTAQVPPTHVAQLTSPPPLLLHPTSAELSLHTTQSLAALIRQLAHLCVCVQGEGARGQDPRLLYQPQATQSINPFAIELGQGIQIQILLGIVAEVLPCSGPLAHYSEVRALWIRLDPDKTQLPLSSEPHVYFTTIGGTQAPSQTG